MNRLSLFAGSIVLACGAWSCTSSAARTDPPRAAARADAPLAPVAFIAGHWKGVHDGGTWEELWTDDEGGFMAGSAKMVVGGRCVFFEHARITAAKDGNVALLVSPAGRHPPTVFPLESSSADVGVMTATFHNPDHDDARKIRSVRTQTRRAVKPEAVLEGEEQGVKKHETISMTRVER